MVPLKAKVIIYFVKSLVIYNPGSDTSDWMKFCDFCMDAICGWFLCPLFICHNGFRSFSSLLIFARLLARHRTKYIGYFCTGARDREGGREDAIGYWNHKVRRSAQAKGSGVSLVFRRVFQVLHEHLSRNRIHESREVGLFSLRKKRKKKSGTNLETVLVH